MHLRKLLLPSTLRAGCRQKYLHAWEVNYAHKLPPSRLPGIMIVDITAVLSYITTVLFFRPYKNIHSGEIHTLSTQTPLFLLLVLIEDIES